jgi:hypothetical protein
VLVDQGEERADRAGAGRGHRLEQPLHDGGEHLVGLEVQRRQRQPAVLAEQEVAAERLQALDGAVEQGADDRLGGLVPGEGVQVALDGGGGGF